MSVDTTAIQSMVNRRLRGGLLHPCGQLHGTVTCKTDDSSGSSVWTTSGSDVNYNSGNVGVGAMITQQEELKDLRGENNTMEEENKLLDFQRIAFCNLCT